MSRASDRLYSRSAFRPSVYSTGLQSLQPYHSKWSEGSEYGEWYNTFVVSPLGWAASKVGDAYVDWKGEGTSGTCIDHDGLLGKKDGEVSCAALKDALEGNDPGTSYAPEDGVLPYALDKAEDAAETAVETAVETVREIIDPPPPPWYSHWYVWVGAGAVVVGGGAFAYSRVKKGKKKNKKNKILVGP